MTAVLQDKGTMAVVGKGFAVLQSSRLRLSGFLAWLAWAAVPLAPKTRHQSFFTSRREKSASARSALNRTNGLHLAATLLCRGVDASRPISNLEKEDAHVSQWSCQAQ